MIRRLGLEMPMDALADFCRRWRIAELSLFGSALRADFSPDSDIDVLIDYPRESNWTLLDSVRMQEELRKIFERPVDLVTRRAVESSRNPIRRKAILESARPIYVA